MRPELREVVWGLRWPEAPRWHEGALFVSDTAGKRLLRVADGRPAETVLTLEAQPNGTWPTEAGIAVASMFDHRVTTLSDGQIARSIDLSALARGPLGDMYGDASGALWIGDFGSFGAGPQPPPPGQLLYVSPEGEASAAADDLAYPNGITIIAGGARLVVAESNGHRLTSFEITGPGGLEGRSPYADLSELGGGPLRPDGIWADADDGIWVAGTDRSLFVRLAGDRVTETIDVSPLRAVACCIGGPQRDVLFLAVAEIGGGHESIQAALAAGDTEAGVVAVSLNHR